MTDLPDPKRRREWLAMLAKLTAPMQAVAAAKALGDMVPMLADYPDGAFTMASLNHVAGNCRRVPSLAELREQLGPWWRQNRPEHVTLANPHHREQAQHADAQASWLDCTATDIRAKVAAVRNAGGPSHQQQALGGFLGTAVSIHLPQFLFLIPPEWRKSANDPKAA